MQFFKSYKFLDMATGTGDLAIDAVSIHPNIEAIGLDFVQEMVCLLYTSDAADE